MVQASPGMKQVLCAAVARSKEVVCALQLVTHSCRRVGPEALRLVFLGMAIDVHDLMTIMQHALTNALDVVTTPSSEYGRCTCQNRIAF